MPAADAAPPAMKHLRQQAIAELVDRERITNQEELRRLLRTRGFDVAQATLSRDIKELGLVKRAADGAYQRAESVAGTDQSQAEVALARALAEYLHAVDRGRHIVVLRTGPGHAHSLGIALDRAHLSEVVGTVAGDDTIFAVTRSEREAARLARRLERLVRERSSYA